VPVNKNKTVQEEILTASLLNSQSLLISSLLTTLKLISSMLTDVRIICKISLSVNPIAAIVKGSFIEAFFRLSLSSS
jgi:hypothetical protein